MIHPMRIYKNLGTPHLVMVHSLTPRISPNDSLKILYLMYNVYQSSPLKEAQIKKNTVKNTTILKFDLMPSSNLVRQLGQCCHTAFRQVLCDNKGGM